MVTQAPQAEPSSEVRSKKHLLWEALDSQPRNAQGEVVWGRNVLEDLREALGMNDDVNVVQTMLYDMEQKGFIKRTRRADGRLVMSIALVKEPPASHGIRQPINGQSSAAVEHKVGEVYAQVMEITPELAMQWLDLNQHNRTLRQSFIERLAAAIKRGEWVLNGESIKINPNFLVDGQHRLWAIAMADMPVKALVAFNVPVEAQETVDTGVKRTLADMLKLRKEKDHTTLAAALVQAHIYGNRGILGLTGAYYPTPQEAFAVLQKHPEIRDSVDIGRRLSANTKFPAGLGAVLHWILSRIDTDDATDFFNRFTTGHNLDEGNPILALRNMMREYDEVRGQDKTKIAALAIKAWNFYRSGNEVTRLVWKAGGAKPEQFPKPV